MQLSLGGLPRLLGGHLGGDAGERVLHLLKVPQGRLLGTVVEASLVAELADAYHTSVCGLHACTFGPRSALISESGLLSHSSGLRRGC